MSMKILKILINGKYHMQKNRKCLDTNVWLESSKLKLSTTTVQKVYDLTLFRNVYVFDFLEKLSIAFF